MHIIACVTQTPDSSSVYVDPLSGKIDIERFVQILNPADACAVEAAVRLKEQLGGTVEALTLGPLATENALRAALALGADTAVRLWNEQASEWEAFTVAFALAAYIRQQQPMPDLILCGDSTSDWASGIVGPALAEELQLPQLTSVSELIVIEDANTVGSITLQATRRLERGYREQLTATTPLLITVTSDLNEPRYPSMPAHIAALRATIPVADPTLWLPSTNPNAETILLEIHTPRPRAKRLPTPDSQHSAFERIGEILTSGATGRQTRLVEGTNAELAQALVNFLHEKGFLHSSNEASSSQ